jgi:hypothetical protein
MQFVNRREFLSAATVPILSLTGCLQQEESPKAKNSEEPEMRLESSVDEIQLSHAEFELMITNEGPGETPFVVMTHRLGVAKVVEGEPRYISPLYSYEDDFGDPLEEGGTYEYEVEVNNEDPDMVDSDLATSLGGVGPGTYRFGHVARNSIPNEETKEIELAEPTTEVEFVGEDSPVLEPPSGLEEDVERDGDVFSVSPSEEHEMLVVERTKGDAPELILEQVLQSPLLRGIVWLFEDGAEQVRWVHNERMLGYVRTAYGIDDRFEYDGNMYEMRTEGINEN